MSIHNLIPSGDLREPTKAEFAAMQASTMTEDQLLRCIVALAQRQGWLVYHTHDSRRSQPGYPDLALIHPARGIHLMRELKTQKGRVAPKQQEWLDGLTAAGIDAGIWRPIDWHNDTISNILYGPEFQ